VLNHCVYIDNNQYVCQNRVIKSHLTINLLGGNVNFSIYRFIKSLRSKGYKIKYINLYFLLIVFIFLACGGFSYLYIAHSVNEFQQAKKNYSHYVNHRVELPTPPVITKILQVAKKSDEIIDVSSYYRVEIGENSEPNTRLFGLFVLEKAKTSEHWAIQWSYSGSRSYATLFNKEWLISYSIDTRMTSVEKDFFNSYFNSQIQFKDQKLFALLTWSPSYLNIYLTDSVFVLFFWLIISGISVIIFNVIVYFRATQLLVSYTVDFFLSNPYLIRGRLDREIKYTALKTKNNIILTAKLYLPRTP